MPEQVGALHLAGAVDVSDVGDGAFGNPTSDSVGLAGESPEFIDSDRRSVRAAASRIARSVAEFHRAYQLPMQTVPNADIDAAQVTLRQALIEEEVGELAAAATSGDLVGIADALADIVYVAYGTAHVYGIDLDAVLTEVHASNMTKLGADGRPVRRPDGKVLKGPDYRAPDVAAVLARIVPSPPPSEAVRD